MGFFDELAREAGLDTLGKDGAATPDLAGAIASLLNPKDGSVGGHGGLEELLGAFAASGLGEQVSSWLSQGANQPVDARQVAGALDADTLRQFAARAGVDLDQAAAALAGVLPGLVDRLTPHGETPDASSLVDLLGRLVSGQPAR